MGPLHVLPAEVPIERSSVTFDTKTYVSSSMIGRVTKIGQNAISFSVDASEIGRAPVDMEKLFPLSAKGFIYLG